MGVTLSLPTLRHAMAQLLGALVFLHSQGAKMYPQEEGGGHGEGRERGGETEVEKAGMRGRQLRGRKNKGRVRVEWSTGDLRGVRERGGVGVT